MKTAALAFIFIFCAYCAWGEAPKESCVTCHSAMEGKLSEAVKIFGGDVHAQVGLGCSDCHGGDRNDDTMDSMSKAKGFRGAPKKAQIPEFCGRCHSDATYMRHFNPKVRTDELSEYVTSVHGKRLKQGDQNVATCVDCHGVHNILQVSDTRSPVYPTNVANTCARCHSDAEKMKQYKIPFDQVGKYQKSVHAKAMADGDLSAPTCTTCHGSHGATPPGVDSVANVCGTCHVFFAQLFDKSPHKVVFTNMGLPGCVQCHSNHAIVVPGDEFVGVTPKSVCVNCHFEGDTGYNTAKAISDNLSALTSALARAESSLGAAERSGMEVSTPKLELANAHEALIKARVNVHTFSDVEVKKFTDQGVAIAKKSDEAGIAALKERDYRRKGLGFSLVFIVIAIAGLYMKIRQMESPPDS
ncbi:MAG: cytochrome c3 family protein [Acidobacteria bacterium]|nr:cytochrome c3 family protein [Acidobacteriota bacterium]